MKSSDQEIRVKILSRYSLANVGELWKCLCPGQKPVWGRCRFLFDPFERDYDWLVVIHDMPKPPDPRADAARAVDTLTCPRSHTLFVTTEPSTIAQYGKAFVGQFGHVLTSQEESALPHPHAIRSQTGNVWFYGKTYDITSTMEPCPKTKLLSTVCSSKRQGHTLHSKRFDFTQRLAREIPEMDVYGHGVRYIAHKYDALDPYAFHLAIENHCAPHHWTEKLADAFLGYNVPFYYGCPDVFDYFPKDSLIPIDIHDFEGSLRIIKESLTFENYQRRLPAVQEARRRVLNQYSLPAMLSRIITGIEATEGACDTRPLRIYNRHDIRVKKPQEFIRFALWRIRNYAQDLWVNGGKRE